LADGLEAIKAVKTRAETKIEANTERIAFTPCG
jgi:hypothetical protein